MVRSKEMISLEAALADGEKPTLKTIARMSGLAVPTVSRALNDAPDIGQDTKVLVRRIADEIGYVPNRAGVRLRTGRTNVISLVICTEHDNHTGQLIASTAQALQGTRFHLNVTPYSPSEDIMKPVRYIVETRSADAIILNQIEPQDTRVAFLMDNKIPFATHGRSDWADRHAYYDYDNGTFGRYAIKLLAERGRKNVAAITPPLAQSYGHHIVDGLADAAKEHGISLTRIEELTSDSAILKIIETLQRDKATLEGYDAIVTASSSSALATCAALEGIGQTVGHETDVVAKDHNSFLQALNPGILTLPESVGDAGEFLAKAAIQAIRHPELPPMQYLEVPAYPE